VGELADLRTQDYIGPSRGEVSIRNKNLTDMKYGGMGTKGVRVVRDEP
jgi:hypothetical protein